MNRRDRSVLDPAILAGKPVVKGTRLAVAFVLDVLAQGWSEREILDQYPAVSRDDVRACLARAGDLVREQRSTEVGTAVHPVAVACLRAAPR